MTNAISCLAHLSDHELLAEARRLAERERHATAQLIAFLVELDTRRLYLGEGCSSLFTYCTQVLRLSEHAAYGRIEAARAARRFPLILDLLADGSVNLTGVSLLARHLTSENYREVLDRARHKSKREIEELVATLHPRPIVPSSVRKLPVPAMPVSVPSREMVRSGPGASTQSPDLTPPAQRPVVKPLAPEQYRVQFTVSRKTHEKLVRAQNLLRHSIPNGDPAAIFDKALTLLLEHLEKTKLAATDRPRAPRPATKRSRHIPAAVRRVVWERDGGQCAFVGTRGRCAETGFLEFHHIEPFAMGGASVTANIEMRCKRHNAYEAEQYFGPQSLFVRERAPLWCRDDEYSVRTEYPRGTISLPLASVPYQRPSQQAGADETALLPRLL